jgi:hypothetical protein
LQQQRFFEQSTALLDDLEAISVEIHNIAGQDTPTGMAEAFRRAGRISDLAVRLEQLKVPEAPPTYQLLGQRLEQVRDTYALAAEDLLTYFGNNDQARRETGLEALMLADEVLGELRNVLVGLQYPLCKEIWRE